MFRRKERAPFPSTHSHGPGFWPGSIGLKFQTSVFLGSVTNLWLKSRHSLISLLTNVTSQSVKVHTKIYMYMYIFCYHWWEWWVSRLNFLLYISSGWQLLMRNSVLNIAKECLCHKQKKTGESRWVRKGSNEGLTLRLPVVTKVAPVPYRWGPVGRREPEDVQGE